MDRESVNIMAKHLEEGRKQAELIAQPYIKDLDDILNMIDTLQNICEHPNEQATGAHGHNDSEYECPDCGFTSWG